MVFNSYSEIIFLQNPWAGLLILLLTFINPNLGMSGIIAVLCVFFFAKFLNMEDIFIDSGFYTYNALLIGLSIGYLFKIDALSIFYIFSSSLLTLIISIALSSFFGYYLKLPILSIPFVLVSSMVYLASSNYFHLLSESLYSHAYFHPFEGKLSFWLSGYFKSLGAVFFLPNILAGIIICVVILYYSRILFMLSIAGYYIGSMVTGYLNGSYVYSFSDTSHFNFILIAMALGGIFLIPSLKSYIMSIAGILSSVIILSSATKFWAMFGIPVFTLPFNFITLSFVYAIGILNFPMTSKIIKETPEDTLDQYLSSKDRFQDAPYSIRLPFSGDWSVWQGNNGKWTHTGSWAYAYDFIMLDKSGKSFKDSGKNIKENNSPTIPFTFTGYTSKKRFFSFGLPEEDEIIRSVYPDNEMIKKFSYNLDDEFKYEVYKNGIREKIISLSVKMSPSGELYFDSGSGKIFFYKKNTFFYCYAMEGKDKYLRAFYSALALIPLAYLKDTCWETTLPFGSVFSGIKKSFLLLLASFNHNISKIRLVARYENKYHISGEIISKIFKINKNVSILLNREHGVDQIEVGEFRFKLAKKNVKYIDEGNFDNSKQTGSEK